MRVRYLFSSRRTGHIENIRRQRQKYPKIVLDLIKISDLVLEVLDARFPEETRNLELEELIKQNGKKVIYVLNKIDLVDVEKKKEEMRKLKLYPYVLVSCRKRIGSTELRNRIKMEAKNVVLDGNMKRVQVGVIGYPNTGKSSLINFLTGKNSAKTGAAPGFTKGMQKIRLTSEILILDTPGVIPDKDYSNTDSKAISGHTKVGARSFDKVKDPDVAVAYLMKDYSKEIESFYGVDANGDSELLLEEVGKKNNLLKKGGVVDDDRAARLVLRDWQIGKITPDQN